VSEPRTLLVTVGTSLFSSASWSWEGDLKSVPGYRGWLEKKFLEDPAKRRREGYWTAEKLEGLLTERGTGVTAEHFATDFDRPLRYSGELTTLLRCYRSPLSRRGESFSEFLQRSYTEIQLLASISASNAANVAARHLQVILRDKLGHPNVSMPETLRSRHLHDLVGFLRDHLEDLTRSGAEVDLLVTGGYKAYSLLAGKFVATQPRTRHWRAFYIHEEESGQLIIEGRGETWIGQEEIAPTRWPPPLGED
jgi:hypothetical protein